MKILVFTEGTILDDRNWLALTREETVERGREDERPSHAGTTPIGEAANKLKTWKRQGAEIVYLTSRRELPDVGAVKDVLKQYSFPAGEVLFREAGEEYRDVAERAVPNIIVEDDCESIGGEVEMTYPRIRAEMKEKIKSIVVKEFGGVDHLPDSLSDLLNYRTT